MAVCMLILSVPVSVSAADSSRSYEFDLSVNGSHEVYAKPGDVLTVTFTLRRTDSDEAAAMYAMQDEIRYDPEFFEIVDGGIFTMHGVETTDIGLIDDYRAFYMNFLSLGGGEEWEAETIAGSFQVKVIGESGSSYLKNENSLVSLQDGSDSYETEVQDLLVVVSSECTVKFDSMGGSEVPDQTVLFGECVKKPEDPVREGHTFNGWYSDIFLKNAWDFEQDTVHDNMTLFAGWQTAVLADAPADTDSRTGFPWWILLLLLLIILLLFRKKKVTYMLDKDNEYRTEKIRKGKTLNRPEDPVREGCTFTGWYQDEAFTELWDFENDKVEKSMKLYARWS